MTQELCRLCGERPCSPRFRVCSRCRHGKNVPCPDCDGTKRPEAVRCKACHSAYAVGKDHGAWKGGRTLDTYGYVRYYSPGHPRAMNGRYIFEHHHVMEEFLGRYLVEGEEVHHRNGIKTDNRLENLELWTKAHPAGVRDADLLKWAVDYLRDRGYDVQNGKKEVENVKEEPSQETGPPADWTTILTGNSPLTTNHVGCVVGRASTLRTALHRLLESENERDYNNDWTSAGHSY